MNRAARKAAESMMRKRQSWEWVQKRITDEERAQYPAIRDIREAFYNDFYSVQIYWVKTDWGEVHHLIVRGQIKSSEPPWRDMQRIKNELVSDVREAIQIYPRATDVVDQADVYHLWVLPAGMGVPFGLHRENGLRKR